MAKLTYADVLFSVQKSKTQKYSSNKLKETKDLKTNIDVGSSGTSDQWKITWIIN